MKIKIKKIHPLAQLPKYSTKGSAGMDITCCEDIVAEPGRCAIVPTGLVFEIPEGYEMQIRPRSGASLRHPNYIANSPATIDSDYRGEVKVLVVNYSCMDWHIAKGSRIAQCVIAPAIQAEIEEVDQLTETERGAGGLGSTGV